MYRLAVPNPPRQASAQERKVGSLAIDDEFQFVVMAEMGEID